jgi:lipoate-protein ligase A
MAVDEALAETAAETGQATLRFYQWNDPTLSLGYFQELADRVRHPASASCPVVRRASGGGAILHDPELTYSLTLPETCGGRSRAAELYEECHASLIAALTDFSVTAKLYRDANSCAKEPSHYDEMPQPFLCFQRRTCFDIVIKEAKIAGSAQRRRRGAILQHGSVLLARSPCAPELPGIEDLSRIAISPADLTAAWSARLAQKLDMRLAADRLSDQEQDRAAALAVGRFNLPGRLLRR